MYWAIATSDGEIHEYDDEEDFICGLDEFGNEVVSTSEPYET